MSSQQKHDKFRASLGRLPTDERVQHALREHLAPLLDDLAGTLRELSSLSWDDRVEALWGLIAADNFSAWQGLRGSSVYQFALDIVKRAIRSNRNDCRNFDLSLNATHDPGIWITGMLSAGLSAKETLNLIQFGVALRDHARQQQMRFRRALDIREFGEVIWGRTTKSLPPALAKNAEYVRARIAKAKLDPDGFAGFVLHLDREIRTENQLYQIKHRTKTKVTTGDPLRRQNSRLTNE
jgi:hypothetical protein